MLIKNGRIIDPSQNLEMIGDVLIVDGQIVNIGERLDDDGEIIDAKGCIVAPGLVDIHVHLREPGFSHKETLKTGSYAAANGGVTTIACMPNTQPAIHNAEVVKWIQEKSVQEAVVHVEIVGSITKDLGGEMLSDIESMIDAGIVAISDDGKTTMNSTLMTKAMETIAHKGIPLISHAEDHSISAGGAMNLGDQSQKTGIPGIPSEAEWKIIQRDIELSEQTGARLHIAHISTKEGVELIRQAKAKGLSVTAEAGPHHFILTEKCVEADKTETKVNPPLRAEADRVAVLQGVLDGTIQVVATDHAPHDVDSKQKPYTQAAFGMVGLETSLALCITELVKKNGMTMMELINRMSTEPARILGLTCGTLKKGSWADIVIIDPEKKWVIDSQQFYSMGKNTAFNGMSVTGQARDVIVKGKIIKRDGVVIC